MFNTNRRIPFINKVLTNNGTKISVYMSSKTAGDDYDPLEQNYTYTDGNPRTLKGYVYEISPEALVWKQYGLKEAGAKEIICDSKYKTWFTLSNRVVINGDDYEVYKEGLGGRVIIQKRPFKMIRVVLQKKS